MGDNGGDDWDDDDGDPFAAMGGCIDESSAGGGYSTCCPEAAERPELTEAIGALCDDSELGAVLRVLGALQEQKEVFLHSVRFKKVRKAVRALSQTLNEKMYDGMSAEEYQRMHINARITNSIKDRMKAKDKQKLEMARLRSARMAQLAALQGAQSSVSEGGQLLPALSAVPDGAVDPQGKEEGFSPGTTLGAQALLAGVGAQNSFAVKQGRRTVAQPDEAGGDAGVPMIAGAGAGQVDDDDPAVAGGAPAASAEPEAEKALGLGGEHTFQERSCYLCKNWFTRLHHFYDQFCPGCAATNWEKRHQRADLSGVTDLHHSLACPAGEHALYHMICACWLGSL
jgi:hypothetical protein